jgi:hypothetical protein
MTESANIPTKHNVDHAGYDTERDGDSWCDCGWEVHEDFFGQQGLVHAWSKNQPYYRWLEERCAADV